MGKVVYTSFIHQDIQCVRNYLLYTYTTKNYLLSINKKIKSTTYFQYYNTLIVSILMNITFYCSNVFYLFII